MAVKSGILAVLLLILIPGCAKRASHEPVVLTFLDVEWDSAVPSPDLAQDLQDFTRETGVQVRRLPAPDGSLNQLALWRELLRKGTGTPDVCSIDVIWPGILSQYLMDLKPHFAKELAYQNPDVLGSYTLGDKLVAIPRHAYIGVLFYHDDLLRRYRYREPPRTWDELERMSARIQSGELARGQKDFWGYSWPGAAGEDLTCGGLEWQVSQGGGRIIEDDKTISVNNSWAIQSWQRAARWVGTISPPGVLAYGKRDSENAFSSGKAAFLHGWVAGYTLINGTQLLFGVNRVGVTSPPAGTEGRVSTLGGNGLAVSRASAHPREALELIRFLLRREIRLLRNEVHMEPPSVFQIFELPLALEPYPQLARLTQHGSRLVARPSVAAGEKYEEVSRAYIRTVHGVLAGEQTAAPAAANLERELAQITGFRRGSPPAASPDRGHIH